MSEREVTNTCPFCGHHHVPGFYCGHDNDRLSIDFCICSGLREIEDEHEKMGSHQFPDPRARAEPIENARSPRPPWDEVWMGFATTISRRSTCARASVGCVIVSDDNSMVLGLGYNGGAKGLGNACLSAEPGNCGHLHAEINALIKANFHDPAHKKAYITTSPCFICAEALVNANVGEVIFGIAYRDQSGVALLRDAGVAVRQFPAPGVPERYLQVDQDR